MRTNSRLVKAVRGNFIYTICMKNYIGDLLIIIILINGDMI